MSNAIVRIRALRHRDETELAAVIALFRASVRLTALRDYTDAQVLAWAPDEIDPGAWAKRYDTRQAWVAVTPAAREPLIRAESLTLTSGEVGSMKATLGILGFIELEGREHLDMLYVHPDHQRRGVATALLEQLESAARARGAEHLRTEASITARPFFERRGFRLIAQQTVTVRGQQFVNFRMEKPLGHSD